MPIEATCSNAACAKRYSVPESMGGRSVRCKACGGSFVVTTVGNGGTLPSPSPPARASSELAGVGRFVVRKKLGAGAFGTVYRAYDPQLDREVALKVPNPGTLDSPQRVERFLREAKAAARLRHPHIVPVFDAGKDDGRYYIASAFIDGQPLADTIEEEGAEFRRAARLARELAEALAYAHDEGIVHRDVKPQNAMVDAQDRLHLMDFGLAARAEDGGEAKLTKDGSVVGTPAYMSPEQAKGQKGEAKPATDQYAVGVVLYELLTGEVPFKGPVAVVIHNVIHTEPEKPIARRRAVPRDLETICLKAMSKRPKDRYAGCQELADDLRRWQEGEPIAARRLSAAERVTRWVRKNPIIAASVTFAFASLVVGTVLALWQLSEARAASAKETAQRKIAEDNETKAGENANEARRQELIANTNAAQTTKAYEELAAETKKAGQARQEKEEALRRELAQSRMAAQRFALLSAREQALKGDFTKARDTLATCPLDSRGWDWHLLAATAQRWEKEKPQQPKFEPRVATAGDLKDVRVLSYQLAPTAKRLVGWCSDKRLRIWDADSGEEKDSLPLEAPGGATVSPTPLGVSPDGRYVALPIIRPFTGKGARPPAPQLGVWDVRDRKLVRTHLGEDPGPSKLADGRVVFSHAVALEFSPDGRWLACAKTAELSKNEPGGRVLVWDVATGQERFSLAVDQADVVCLAFSPDGTRLAGGTSNIAKDVVSGGGVYITSKLQIWNLTASPPPATTFPLAAGATSVRFSPDGRLVACGDYLDRVVVADAATGNSRFVGFGPSFGVVFTPDSARLVCVDVRAPAPGDARNPVRQLTLKSWDTATGQELIEIATSVQLALPPTTGMPFTQPHPAVISGRDGTTLTLHDGNSIRAFDVQIVNEPFAMERGVNQVSTAARGAGEPPVRALAFSPDDRWLGFVTTTKAEIPGRGPQPRQPGGPPPSSAELLRDSVAVRSIVQVWNGTDGRLVAAFNGPAAPVIRMAVSSDGERVALLTRRITDARTGPVGGTPGPTQVRDEVSLWDVKKQVVLRTWSNLPGKAYRALGFRTDGSHLSLVGGDAPITWRLSDGAKVEGINFEASETDTQQVWKSPAGDVVTAPNLKRTPASMARFGVGISSDGRRRARVLGDANESVVVEEIR